MVRRISQAAYFLIDIMALEPRFRQEVMEDAETGGDEFGVKIVEEVHNGPARTAIYGVYKQVKNKAGEVIADDEGKWEKAKAAFNVPDGADDEDEEEKLRAAAATQTDAAAAAALAAEEANVKAVTGETKNKLK